MTDQPYNGYTNFETFAVGMFLDGNYTGEGTYRTVRAAVETFRRESEATYQTIDLSNWLQEFVEDHVDAVREAGGLAGDLLGAALSEVNWLELAADQFGL